MGTLIVVLIGLFSYVGPVPAHGLTPEIALNVFIENYNYVGWICAVVATLRYFFSVADFEEPLPRVCMIIMDTVVGIDLILKGVIWLQDMMAGAHDVQELVKWLAFILVPVILVILNWAWGKVYLPTEATAKSGSVLASAELAVLGTSYILCYLNPVTNPRLNYSDIAFGAMSTFLGCSEGFVPTFGNILSWSWRMKLLLAVCIVTILESFLCDAKKNFGKLVDNILMYTLFFVITVYLMLGFFKIRDIVYDQFWYFFVELALQVGFGMIACLLPFVLLFPNTAKVLTSGVDSPSKSSSGSAAPSGPNALDRLQASRSVASLPYVIYLDGEQLNKQSGDQYSARYCDMDGNEYVITSVSISGNSASTNIGYVRWY